MNEDTREIVADLIRSLAEQPASTTALLEQPAHPASPVVLPPAMSLGPTLVTDSVRAEERAEKRARKQREEPPVKRKTAAPKKKPIPPELEERRRRASARMIELRSTRGKFLKATVMYLYGNVRFFVSAPKCRDTVLDA